MKIKDIYLENFRGYKNRTKMSFESLTAIIGKNDIGKSTILEALDIFFNDNKGLIKLDVDDKNMGSVSDEIIIGVIFEGFPSDIIVDTSVHTSLKDEFLLNEQGKLEIKKTYKKGKCTGTFLVAHYPDDEKVSKLHMATNTNLKKILESMELTVDDLRKSSLIRKSILSNLGDVNLVVKDIQVDKEGGKQIWDSLMKYMPLFELFQSDRKNGDQDGEIQNPMKLLIKEIMKDTDIKTQLDSVFENVKSQAQELAENALKKLEEMNPEIAKELKPSFNLPTWEKVFSFSLETENEIPVNKRGSGVRRLILLNFFRAEAERRRMEKNVPNIIYAFEEPETSQHADHQKILIESFMELANSENNQIILTTHHSAIAKLLPIESLRLIKKNDQGENIVLSKDDDERILDEIANDLGVLPNILNPLGNQVKLAICVEGKNDISFLRRINEAITEFKDIVDLDSEKIIIFPMGGSTLQFWVNNNYLGKLNLAQFHLYDSDKGAEKPNKYQPQLDIINNNGTRSIGVATQLRELENYITPSVVQEYYPDLICNFTDEQWGELDVPEFIAKHVHESDQNTTKTWSEVKEDKKKNKKSRVKNRINEEIVTKITKEVLEKHGYYEEVKNWFISMNLLLNQQAMCDETGKILQRNLPIQHAPLESIIADKMMTN